MVSKSYLYDRHMYCVENNKVSLKRPTEIRGPARDSIRPNFIFNIYL